MMPFLFCFRRSEWRLTPRRTIWRARGEKLIFGRDSGAADKSGFFIHDQLRRFDVPSERAAGSQLATFTGLDVTVHRSVHHHRAGSYFALDVRVLSHRESADGIDRSFDLSIDLQFGSKFDRAVDRHAT